MGPGSKFHSPGTRQLAPHCPWLPFISVQVLFHLKYDDTYTIQVVIWATCPKGISSLAIYFMQWCIIISTKFCSNEIIWFPIYWFWVVIMRCHRSSAVKFSYHVVQHGCCNANLVACNPFNCEGKSTRFGRAVVPCLHGCLISRGSCPVCEITTQWAIISI